MVYIGGFSIQGQYFISGGSRTSRRIQFVRAVGEDRGGHRSLHALLQHMCQVRGLDLFYIHVLPNPEVIKGIQNVDSVCKGGRGRTGGVIAAYIHYSNICASTGKGA